MGSEFRLIGLFSLAATCVYRIKSPEISETLILSHEETNTTCELRFFIIVWAEDLTFCSPHYTRRQESDWIISPCKEITEIAVSTHILFLKQKTSKFLMRIKIETILAFIIVKLFFIIIYLEYIEKKVIVLCEKDVLHFFILFLVLYLNWDIIYILYCRFRVVIFIIFIFIHSSQFFQGQFWEHWVQENWPQMSCQSITGHHENTY